MPSNTASERSDAAGSSSKTSLLWAYQLRREHVHLVDRIDDMSTQLVSYNDKSQTYEQNLSTLDGLVKTLQAENYTLKNEVTLVRTKLTARIEGISQQITAFLSGDNAAIDATKQLKLEFRAMGLQMSELSKSVSGLKGEIASVIAQKGGHCGLQADAEAGQGNAYLAKIESVLEQIETRPKCIVRLSLGKKRDHPEPSPEPAAEITNAPDSMLSQAVLSALSTVSDQTESLVPGPMPLPNPYDRIFQQIHQNGRTISDYLVFTSNLRIQLPRRVQGIAGRLSGQDWVGME
uniref:Uncharacterized protein n=1 Tax=Talaromyces marneffei PM1 TaxID=1077442 RepID=A0A093VIV1_TALMA